LPVPVESPPPAPLAAPSAESPPQEADVPWRVIPVTMTPGPETDPRVLRTAAEWAALFEGTGTPPPEIAFERDMVVLLPARLAIEAVKSSGAALLFECRRVQADPDDGPTPPTDVRLAVIVPISDLPARVVAP